jgi:LPS-assembly lipoprotein
MKRVLQTALVACALAALPGCGFSPVYDPGAMTAQSVIQIPQIDGRTGHFLRQELAQTIGRGVPGLPNGATLDIKLNEGVERLAFKVDQAASRSDYLGNATWTLRGPGGEVVASGIASEAASFDFADAAYADIAAQTAAQERLANLLARSIRTQVLAGVREKASAPAADK